MGVDFDKDAAKLDAKSGEYTESVAAFMMASSTDLSAFKGRGGKLVIPSFAIGRVEEVLYWLKRLEDSHRIPVLPVYLDSPMAIAALQFYIDRRSELDVEATVLQPTPTSPTAIPRSPPT